MPERKKHQWISGRCDNKAACYVSYKHLSTKPLMAWAVRKQVEIESRFDVSILLDHLAGEENSVPDLLSRGMQADAMEILKTKGGGYAKARVIQLGARWDSWLEEIKGVMGTMQRPKGVWDLEALEKLESEAPDISDRFEDPASDDDAVCWEKGPI